MIYLIFFNYFFISNYFLFLNIIYTDALISDLIFNLAKFYKTNYKFLYAINFFVIFTYIHILRLEWILYWTKLTQSVYAGYSSIMLCFLIMPYVGDLSVVICFFFYFLLLMFIHSDTLNSCGNFINTEYKEKNFNLLVCIIFILLVIFFILNSKYNMLVSLFFDNGILAFFVKYKLSLSLSYVSKFHWYFLFFFLFYLILLSLIYFLMLLPLIIICTAIFMFFCTKEESLINWFIYIYLKFLLHTRKYSKFVNYENFVILIKVVNYTIMICYQCKNLVYRLHNKLYWYFDYPKRRHTLRRIVIFFGIIIYLLFWNFNDFKF